MPENPKPAAPAEEREYVAVADYDGPATRHAEVGKTYRLPPDHPLVLAGVVVERKAKG